MLSATQFSKKIKEKYPQYKDVDDIELATKIVDKYPVYKNQVDLKKKDVAAPKEEIPTISLAPGEELPDQQAPQPVIAAAPSPSKSQLPSAEIVPEPPVDPVDEDMPGINPDALAEVRNWFKDQNGAAFYYGESSPNRKAKFDEYVGLINNNPAQYNTVKNQKSAFAGLFNAQKKTYYENPNQATEDYKEYYQLQPGQEFDFSKAMEAVKTGKRNGVDLTPDQIKATQDDLDYRINQLAVRNHNRLLSLVPLEGEDPAYKAEKRKYTSVNEALVDFKNQVDKFVPDNQERQKIYGQFFNSMNPVLSSALTGAGGERGLDIVRANTPGYSDLNDYQVMYLESLKYSNPEMYENRLRLLSTPSEVAKKQEGFDFKTGWEKLQKEAEDYGLEMAKNDLMLRIDSLENKIGSKDALDTKGYENQVNRLNKDYESYVSSLNQQIKDGVIDNFTAQGLLRHKKKRYEEQFANAKNQYEQNVEKYATASEEDKAKLQGYVDQLKEIENTKASQSSRYYNAWSNDVLDKIGKSSGIGTYSADVRFLAKTGRQVSNSIDWISGMAAGLWGGTDSRVSDITNIGNQVNYDLLVNRPHTEIVEGNIKYAIDKDFETQINQIVEKYGWEDPSKTQSQLQVAWQQFRAKTGKDPVAIVPNENAGNINLSANAILNNVEDIASQIIGTTILAGATGGTGNISKARQLATLFGTTFATTVKDYETQAVRDGKNNPTETAIISAMADAVTELFGNDLARVKRLFGGRGSVGKVLDGISQAEWDKVLRARKGVFGKFRNAGEQVFAKTVSPALTETAEEMSAEGIKNLFEGKEFTHNMKNTGITTFIGTLATFGTGLPFSYKSVTQSVKSAMYEAGSNPDFYIDNVKKLLAKGDLTQKEAKQRMDVINRMSKIVSDLTTINKDGKPISDKQKVNMAFNQYVKEDAQKQKSVTGENEKLNQVTEELDAENNQIVNNEEELVESEISEETKNKYLATYNRQINERKKELRDQGVTDFESDEKIKEIQTKIDNLNKKTIAAPQVPQPEEAAIEEAEIPQEGAEAPGVEFPTTPAGEVAPEAPKAVEVAAPEVPQPKVEEVKAAAPITQPQMEEEVKPASEVGYNSKNLPNPVKDFVVVEVIPYTDVDKNKFKPDQQLKFNQGDYYEPVRIVGHPDLIELIQIGARVRNNLTSSSKKFINKERQEYLENKYGVSAYDANQRARNLAKENRDNIENIIIIGETIPEVKEEIKEELPFGEVTKAEPTEEKEEKDLRKRALSIEPTDIKGFVLQYFINGGKINPKSIKELFGGRGGAEKIRWAKGKAGVGEQRATMKMQDKNGPTLNELAHNLWENSRSKGEEIGTTQDFRNAIEEVLGSHTGTKSMAQEMVESYDADYMARLNEQEREAMSEEAHKAFRNIAVRIPQAIRNEILTLLDKYRNSNGFVDWKELEDATNGFDADILNLSPESSKFLNDAIEQVKQTGRLGGVPSEVLPTTTEPTTAAEPAAPPTRRKAEKGKYTKGAEKIAKSIMKAELPSWLKADLPSGTEKMGIDEDAIKKALAAAVIKMGKLLDKGVEFSQAVKEATKNLTKLVGEDKAQSVQDNFTDYYKQQEDAIQKRGAEEVLQRKQEGAGEPGGKRERMERGKQRIKAAEEKDETQSEEEKLVPFTLGGVQQIGDKFGIEVDRDPIKSDKELKEQAEKKIDEWQKSGEYASNIEKLLKMIEGRTGVLTDWQKVILENHLNNLDKEFEKIDPIDPKFDQKLLEIQRVLNLASMARSEAGRALRQPTIGVSVTHPVESLSNAMIAKMEANGQDELTDDQKLEVINQVAKYKEALANAEEKIRQLEEKAASLEIEELKVEEKSQEKKSGKKKTKEQRQQDRKDALNAARQALRDVATGKSGLSSVPLPFIPQLIAIAPHVKTVVSSYVGEGVDNLSEIIDKVHEEFKDVLPGISKRNIRQIISGQFSSKAPKSELMKIARQIQSEAKALEEYENLLEGKPVEEKQKRIRNKKLADLRKKIKALRNEKELGETYGDNKIPDELKKIRAIQSRNEKMYAEVQRKIAEGDFSKPQTTKIIGNTELKKRFPKEYNAMLDSIKKREDAKHEFDVALLNDELANQTKWQKTVRKGKQLIATMKALRSGIDDSAVLVQNYVAILAHPTSGAKAFLTHIDHAFSQKRMDRWFTELENNTEVWNLIQNSGLDVTKPSSLSEQKREEAFSDNILDKDFTYKGKKYNIGKYTTRPFERMFTSMGNALRVDVFLRISEKWHDKGITFETHPEDYKALARMLNTETGRGKLHKNIQAASDLITPIIWSPRLMQSKFNILGLSDLTSAFGMGKGYYASMPPKLRKMAAKDLARFISVGGSLMALAFFTGAGDADLDPWSSSFGTISIGNKKISVFDGFNKYVKTLALLLPYMNERKVPLVYATESGGLESAGYEKQEVGRMKTIGRFFRGSVTPAAGLGINLLTEEDYMGRPLTWQGEAASMIKPMSVAGIQEEVEKDGMLGLIAGGFKFFGTQISDNRDYEKKAKMETEDYMTGNKRPVTKKEWEEFADLKQIIYGEYLEDYKSNFAPVYLKPAAQLSQSERRTYPNGKISVSEKEGEEMGWDILPYEKLTPDQIKELLKMLESKASDAAKKEMDL